MFALKRVSFSLAFSLLLASGAAAYDFMEGGLAFNRIPGQGNRVEVTRINDDVLPNSDAYESMYTANVYRIPETVTHDGVTYTVTRIGWKAFDKSPLKEIYLSDKLNMLDSQCFNRCENLSKIEMPAVDSIAGYSFGGCYSLHELTLPSTLRYMPDSAFPGRDLSTGKAPVYKLIFECDPGQIADIRWSDRYCYTGLEEVVISSKVSTISNTRPFGQDAVRTITFEETPEPLKYTVDYPFYFLNYATCINIFRPLATLKPTELPGKATEIHLADFAPFPLQKPSTTLLNNCTLYVHANQMEAYKAHEYWGLFNIEMEPGSDIPAPDLTYGYNFELDSETATAKLIASGDEVDPYMGNQDIPAYIRVDGKWYTVTSIGYQAFFDTKITSVKLPSTIRSIEQSAFNFCDVLASVTLNEGLEKMEWDAFANSPALRSITIPGSLKTIPYNAFGNSGIERLTVCEGVEVIEQAFAGCANLTEISLPGTVTTLDGAFNKCSSLREISLPSSLRTIGWFTFAATAIESLELPEGLETLDMQSLGMMNGDHNRDYTLKKVVFPSTLRQIDGMTLNNRCGITDLVFNGDGSPITVTGTPSGLLAKSALATLTLNRTFVDANGNDVGASILGGLATLTDVTFGADMTSTPALQGCTGLKNVTVLASVPPVAGEFAAQAYANATLNVPFGTSAAYHAADVWKNFANISDGSPLSSIDASKIRYTVGEGSHMFVVALRFANDRRLDNMVWGYRSDDANPSPEAIIEAIAAADGRLHITPANGITAVAVDLNNDGTVDSRDVSLEGPWQASVCAVASDKITPVVSLICTDSGILDAPYWFYLPSPDEEGIFIPEAMTVKLSDEGFVLPVLVQTPGGRLSYTTNWQASKSNTSYRRDNTVVDAPFTLVDDTFNAVPTFVGATGTTYVRYRPQKYGEYAYWESNYMTLTVEAPEIPMTSISVSPAETETALDRNIPFEYTFEPADATYTAVNVTSDNDAVVSWTAAEGLRSTRTAGNAVVTVSSKFNPEVKAQLNVTSRLMKPVTGVTFAHASADGVINVPVRRLVDLRPVITPADADLPSVSIRLTDNGTAKDNYTCSTYLINWSDLDGSTTSFYELSGHRPTGTNPAKLTVTSSDGTFSREFTVNVTEPDRTPRENGYVDGTFILNEEWFGHTNGGLNYITEDDEIVYQAYERENPAMSFGCTSQFATIWGGKLIVVSKQASDGGDPLPGGGRLVIADATTLKRLGSLDDLTFNGKSGDGRAVAGATPEKLYVTSSNGIFIVDISDPAKPLVTGRIGLGQENEDLYSGQTGDIINAGKYAFALMQNTGIIAIDTATDIPALIISDTSVQGITQTADGKVWYATAGNNASSRFVAIDPTTLDVIDSVNFSAEIGTVTCSWGSWRSTPFYGTHTSNDIWFVTGGGSVTGGASGNFYRYHVGDDPSDITPFFSLDGVTAPNGFGEDVPQMTYGTPRFDDRNNRLVVMSCRKGAYSGHYRDAWIHYVDGESAQITRTFHLDPYYWFQSMPVFPDKHLPQINLEQITIGVRAQAATLDLGALLHDPDNIDANISVRILEQETPGTRSAASLPSLCTIEGKTLTIVPQAIGEHTITLVAESNGVRATRTIPVTVDDSATGLDALEGDTGCDITVRGSFITFTGLEGATFRLFDYAGRMLRTIPVPEADYTVGAHLTQGVYILRGDNGLTRKIVIR